MAAEAGPIEVENVRDEERFFGGDIAWWTLLLLVSMPVLLLGLRLTPDPFGFLVLSVGGIMAGVAFAQITMRMPYLTHGFLRTLLIAFVVAMVIAGIGLWFSLSLEVPSAPADVMFKPPISGG
ncbi:MAG TPA: hypothetical protein VF937_00215 [Chloroflexota bacterium]